MRTAIAAAWVLVAACGSSSTPHLGGDAGGSDGAASDDAVVDAANSDAASSDAAIDGSTSPDAAAHPTVVFSAGFTNPREIVVDNGEVYWASDKYIYKCATTATPPCWGPATQFVGTPVTSGGIGSPALDAANLYVMWAGGQPGAPAIGSCARSGCNQQGTVLITSLVAQAPVDMVVDNGLIYWTDLTPPGRVLRCPTTGCNGPSTLVTNTAAPQRMTQDENNVYWVSGGAATGDIAMCPKAGCNFTATVIASGRPYVTDLAVYQGTVYWTEAQRVMSCPITGCVGSPTVIASGGITPTSPLVDASGVYFIDNGRGTINHCPLAGCPGGVPEELAWGQAGPNFLAMDATYLFWTNAQSGEVIRMLR